MVFAVAAVKYIVPLLWAKFPPVTTNDPPIVEVAVGSVTVPALTLKSFVTFRVVSVNDQLPEPEKVRS